MIASHVARHTSSRDSAGTQAGLGLSNLEPAGAECGRQTGPWGGLTDRLTDGYATEPTGLPQKDSDHHKGGRRGKMRLRVRDANYNTREPLRRTDSILHFPEGVGAPQLLWGS